MGEPTTRFPSATYSLTQDPGARTTTAEQDDGGAEQLEHGSGAEGRSGDQGTGLRNASGWIQDLSPPSDRQDGHMAVTDFPKGDMYGESGTHRRPNPRRGGNDLRSRRCNEIARPDRFVSLCSAGHLWSRLDWNHWIEHRDGCTMRNNRHNPHRDPRGQGSRFNLGAFLVRCTSCGGERSLRGVTSTVRKTVTHTGLGSA